MMKQWIVRAGLMAFLVGGVGLTLGNAAGPGGSTSVKKSSTKITITCSTYTANLTFGEDTPAGTAVYRTVTITTTCWSGTTTSTCATLTVSGVNIPLADGTGVVFEIDEDESHFGSATVTGGRVSASYSTKQGVVIPFIGEDTEFDIEEVNEGEFEASGTFGPPKTTVTTIGR